MAVTNFVVSTFVMSLDEFCEKIKENYAFISSKADKLYDDYWNDLVEMEFSSYSWFESLANAINDEMNRKASAQEYAPLFKEIGREHSQGQAEVERAIDVAFVENLYWQVSPQKAEPFWEIMPKDLKELYVRFHGKPPL